ncbi:MAG: hypothetical protein R2734_20880 [Nocardioides sp.]
MRAADVMQTYPSIDVNAPADDAVRMIGQEHRPAVLVLKDGRPLTVLPGSQVLNFLIPGYLQEDPSLVKVCGEKASDACAERLLDRTVGDLLPKDRRLELPAVKPAATIMECRRDGQPAQPPARGRERRRVPGRGDLRLESARAPGALSPWASPRSPPSSSSWAPTR